MDSRKTDRGCFGTKELSIKSVICIACLDFDMCKNSRYKKIRSIKNGVG